MKRPWGCPTPDRSADPITLAIGLAALALIFALRTFAPKAPAALVTVVPGIVAAGVADSLRRPEEPPAAPVTLDSQTPVSTGILPCLIAFSSDA